MSTEKRAHQRYAVEVKGEVTIDGDVAATATNDVSVGGCGLVAERAIPDSGDVELTLFLTQDGIEDPDEEPFETTAQVMWSAPRDDGRHAAGLKFGALGQADRERLEHFLRAIS